MVIFFFLFPIKCSLYILKRKFNFKNWSSLFYIYKYYGSIKGLNFQPAINICLSWQRGGAGGKIPLKIQFCFWQMGECRGFSHISFFLVVFFFFYLLTCLQLKIILTSECIFQGSIFCYPVIVNLFILLLIFCSLHLSWVERDALLEFPVTSLCTCPFILHLLKYLLYKSCCYVIWGLDVQTVFSYYKS